VSIDPINDYDMSALMAVSESLEWDGKVRDARTKLLAGLYPEQLRYLTTTTKNNVSCTPRQVGKTEIVAVRKLILGALTSPHPRALCGYTTDTAEHAKGLAWTPLTETLDSIEVPYTAHEQTMDIDIHTPTGDRTISLFGCDDEIKAKKARGYQFWKYVVDEGQSIREDSFRSLLQSHVSAGLGAWNGELCILGTPGVIKQGFYSDIWHRSEEMGYTRFRWTHDDNVAFPRWRGDADWQKRKDEWILGARLGRTEAVWRREYLGEWVSDDEAFLYYLSAKNLLTRTDFSGLPCVLAVDLGWNDKCAFVVLACDKRTGEVFVIHYEQHSHMVLDALSATVKQISEIHRPMRIVMDSAGAGKIIQQSMTNQVANRFGLSIKPAKKSDKAVHVALLRNIMERGRFYAPAGEYTDHMNGITRDPMTGYEKKDATCDMGDATVYAYRELYEFLPDPTASKHVPTEDEQIMAALVSRDRR